MNEEKDPVEILLERMRPADLNNDLMARLTAARGTIAPARSHWFGGILRWLTPVGAVAAVALLTVKVLDSGTAGTAVKPQSAGVATTPVATKTMPVLVQDNMLKAREMGVIVGPNRQPYQVMEYQWVESETIVPGSNAPAVRVETTRRHIVPVELEVY
ncbi:MAG: hypothetical protein RL088_1511 [Verrucomicrobiota bacterium]|jgi:hypothetical protein